MADAYVTVDDPAVRAGGSACDCRQCPFYQVYCQGCNNDCESCLCVRGDCSDCSVRRPDSRGLDAWWKDSGGSPAFDLPAAGGNVWAEMPRLVWVSDDGDRTRFPKQEWWATRISATIDTAGRSLFPQYNNNAGKGGNSKEIWFGWGKDDLIERWWSHRRDWIHDNVGRYQASVAPNYSVYGTKPRMEHLLNMKRSLKAANMLEAGGFPSVPNVYWFRMEDIDRWAEWMERFRPSAVGHNLTTYRAGSEWNRHSKDLKYAVKVCPPGVRWVFHGTRSRRRLGFLSDLFGDYVLLSQAPVVLGQQGRILDADGREQELKARPYEVSSLIAARLESWLDGSGY